MLFDETSPALSVTGTSGIIDCIGLGADSGKTQILLRSWKDDLFGLILIWKDLKKACYFHLQEFIAIVKFLFFLFCKILFAWKNK